MPFRFIVIKQINTLKFSNSLRNVLSFENRWVYWIEGIGSVIGLLYSSELSPKGQKRKGNPDSTG
jgi:hypothetical protein